MQNEIRSSIFDRFSGEDSQLIKVWNILLVLSLHTALLGPSTGLSLLMPANSATDMLTSLMSRQATSLLPAVVTQLMSSQLALSLVSGLMTV